MLRDQKLASGWKPLLFSIVLTGTLAAGCGGSAVSDFQMSKDKPAIDTGAVCAATAPSPIPTSPSSTGDGPPWCDEFGNCDIDPYHSSEVALEPSPAPQTRFLLPPSSSGLSSRLHAMTTPSTATVGAGSANTTFCHVDAQGNISSGDLVNVQDGQRFVGTGGGCIARPIREVWATVLDYPQLKDSRVAEFNVTPRPDLRDYAQKIFFAFDIESVVKPFPLIEVRWVSRWYHSVPCGTYDAPIEVAVNFQKVSGTDHIRFAQDGYVLDQVTPNVTSFAMIETIDADQTGHDDVANNIRGMLNKLRNNAPDWSMLPPLQQ